MPRPLMTIIVPVYGVERYLPDFLESLAAQQVAPDSLEVIFVDDGSPDDSNAIIQRWIDAGHPSARLLAKANGGLASARNLGLDEATGEWVSFPDPDDVLGPNYLETVQNLLRSDRAAPVHLVATNILYLEDERGEIVDSHPLRFKFAGGEQTMSLSRFPHFIHLQAASAFYRRELIDRFGLRFDSRIRPNFEDGALTALYLSHFDEPMLRVMPSARYHYRRRSDGTSLVQGSWSQPEKYTDLLRYGHLGVLETIRAERGRVPTWAQNLMLYELTFYFRHDARPNSPTGGISAETSAEFHVLLAQILALIDVETIDGFRLARSNAEIRTAMLMCRDANSTVPDRVHLDRLDQAQRLVRATYYFTGDSVADHPAETFRLRGRPVRPVHQKVRTVRFLGAIVMYQRILWLPANGTLSVELGGRLVPLALGPEIDRRYRASPGEVWNMLAEQPAPEDIYRAPGQLRGGWSSRMARSARAQLRRVRARARLKPSLRIVWALRPGRRPGEFQQAFWDQVVRTYARSPAGRRKYRDAWLLMDRDDQAQDNAEHLYRYLRRHQPDVNAWFVLSGTSSDWKRLGDEGFRLIDHNSRRHTAALMNCVHLISSQVDHYVIAPLDPTRFGRQPWRYTFLQHGVIKDDLSAWLNTKPISRMLTTTPDEHESIVGDGTPYVLTTKEVSLTGLPRHDRLLELSRSTPTESRLVLVTPTWRNNLVLDRVSKGNARALRDDFWESHYAVEWRKILESERLSKLAAEHGWDVVFVPHPNMQDYLHNCPLPDTVSVRRFADVDIQSLVARAGLMLTDYSSMAFEMSYIRRPVVYFQFDQAEFFSGAHVYRRGDWSYEDDGFGPVALDAEAAVSEASAIIARDGGVDEVYAQRMAAAFPYRDGGCCERVYESILAINRQAEPDDFDV